MSGFQNTRQRFKDANVSNGSSVLNRQEMIVSTDATSGTVRVAEFLANTSSGAANVAIVEAVHVKTVVGIGATPVNINTRVAALHAELDMSSNSGASVANASYCAIFDISSNTATRTAARPTAFLAFGDYGSTKANGVQFLMDIGYGNTTTAYVNAASGTANNVYRANTVATQSGALTIRVNGVVKYIPLYDALA